MGFDTSYIAGATSKIVRVKAITISTGLPYTAGAYNTATIAATYTRDGAAATTITLVTATAGTYTSSGFVHAGKGVYEIGAPTAALASGADGVIFSVDGIADVLFSNTRVELLGVDPRSATPPDVNVTKVAGTTQTAGDLVAAIAAVAFDVDGIAGAVILTNGTVGATGNSTTAAHTASAGSDDDRYNEHAVMIFDASDSYRPYVRWVSDYVGSTEVATLTPALPITPVSGDLYFYLATRRDVTGGSGLDAAGVRAAVGLASANLDTQLGDLPTNAELATSQAAADDATLAAIAAVEAKVDTIDDLLDTEMPALTTAVADLPTNAELATALAAADDAVLAAIAALNNLSAAQVNAEVVDVLRTDTVAELGAAPAATATLSTKITWLYMLARNKVTQTATTQSLKADDGSTDVATAAVSDDGTTATRNEFA